MSTEKTDQYFDSLYGASDDPYSLRTRWYEERKRAVLLAALPQRRYRRAYEPGCGIGELTVALSTRCDEVLASDFSDRAVGIARQRMHHLRNVQVETHRLPEDWPVEGAPFDLIVLSEVGYFLSGEAMRRVAARCGFALADGGVLVACDWRPDFEERRLSTDAVHEHLAALGLARLVRHEESDFLLEVWSQDGRSVAQQEGIR